ncbi:MAG: RHS repeat-associated core domain-containing protein [Sphingobacteriaceae bacterium]|nr:RHS repeat-associated core domain-containing protein [Sphingobacteriaceae bacterium]
MYYDPLGRVVKTVNPDRSEQRVVYGVPNNLNTPNNFAPTPWENFTYDSNDLASITNPTGSNVPATDYFTPKSAEVDALGRTIKTTEYFDNSNYNNTIVMQYHYDIRGNLLLVKDPYNRNVFEHVYDLRTPQEEEPLPPLWTKHIDKGESTVLFDALAKPIESNDAKGARGLSAYDTLQRPTHSWANNKTGDATTLRNFLEYGDSAGLVNPENENLKGKLYKNYDEAGLIEIPEYDFKGNVLTKKRQVIADAELKPSLNAYTAYIVDWTGLPSILDSFIYETNNEFDALNRVTKITLPEDVNTNRKEIIPEYNRAGALEKVKYDGDEYVKRIAYNAKGQRILIALGNDVMTRYVYDTFTFRLIRQRSEGYTFSQTGNTLTYAYQSGTNKQDDKYINDLIGNIVEINTRTTACGIGGTDSLDREFEYDAIYRLTQATGRENVTGANYPFPGWQDMTRSNTPNTTVGYTRNYSYDKLGNIEQMQQVGTNAFTRTFNYITATNKLNGVTIGANSYAYTFDNCGNQLTENSNRKFEWDANNRLILFKDQVGISEPTVEAQYLYDNEGKRTKKIVRKQGGDFEIRVYIDGVFEFYTDETDTQNTIHIMDNASRVATVRIGAAMGDTTPAIKYEIENNIGSSMVLLDDTGATVNTQEYYPFGETSFGSYAKKRYQYVGKERDEESGLYYYGARYYSPWICRFFGVDPLAADFPFYTPYNYAGNKPINKIDIDGLQEEGGSNQQDNSATTYGPLTQQEFETQQSANQPSLPEVNGVKGPWSPEFIANNNGIGNNDNSNVDPGKKPIQLFDSTDKTKFVGLGDKRLTETYPDSKTKEQLAKNLECYYLAEFQTELSGAEMLHGYRKDNALNVKNNDVTEMVDYINKELEAGHAVSVGIDYDPDKSHTGDPFGTDHFITIVGRSFDENGIVIFNFYDNATQNFDRGTSSENKLSVIDNKLQGISMGLYGKEVLVTRVQKNK